MRFALNGRATRNFLGLLVLMHSVLFVDRVNLAAAAIANAESRMELRGFAKEQAALRRVATLVAQAAPPAEVLTAVAGEAGRLLHADYATMHRYAPDGTVTVAAAWSRTGAAFPVGGTARLGASLRRGRQLLAPTRRAQAGDQG